MSVESPSPDEPTASSLNPHPSPFNPSDTLLACSFNMHKVTRHVLRADGATFASTDDDLLVCDDVDFHPTDVIEDADGSLLVVDTGGWYKLCCPTSQLHKPDVIGAIYRLRRAAASKPDDPRGTRLGWRDVSPAELVRRFDDERFAVRRRAVDEVAERGREAIAELALVARSSATAETRRLAVWALTRIDDESARAAVRARIADEDLVVRRSAIRSAGLWRDQNAVAPLRERLCDRDPSTRRVAAEALGRTGAAEAVADLLAAAAEADEDRFFRHAVRYALWEIHDPVATHDGLAATAPGTVSAALIALGQMPDAGLQAEEVLARLDSPDRGVREAAAWVLERKPEWETAIAGHLGDRLRRPDLADAELSDLRPLMVRFASRPAVRDLIAELLRDRTRPMNVRDAALEAMTASRQPFPAAWTTALAEVIDSSEPRQIASAVAAASVAREVEGDSSRLLAALGRVGRSDEYDGETRLKALRIASAGRELEEAAFDWLVERLADERTATRLAAADVLAAATLDPLQLRRLAESLPTLGPMELDRLLPAFGDGDDAAGLALVQALQRSPSAADLLPQKLEAVLGKFGPRVRDAAKPLFERPAANQAEQRARLDEFLASPVVGDPGRGHAVFQSGKAACSTCHAVGYLGGRVGPDLTGIGKIRTDRDLLESILYPSASLVRSYEPVVIVTADGSVLGGIPRDDGDSVTLTVAADKSVSVPRGDIQEMRPGTTSIMPAGLERQLSPQELADLVAFLKASQ